MTPEQARQVNSLVYRSDVFNYVIDHLRSQGRRSVAVDGDKDEKFCAYRGAEGTMCAVGALITDDEYNSDWETLSIAGLLRQSDLPSSLRKRLIAHEEMVQDLQDFHDSELYYIDGVFSVRSEDRLAELRTVWNIK